MGFLRKLSVPVEVGVFFSALYVATLFPGVGGRINHGDSAKFAFIGKVFGLSHPPGNPLYMVLNGLWVRLPLPVSCVTRVSLLSAVFGVATLVYVARALRRLAGNLAATVGAVALGAGPIFWTFSTEPEVYTLNTFLLAAAMHHAIAFSLDGERRDLRLGSAFFLLGFANHLTSLMLVPAFGFLLYSRRASVTKKDLLFIGGMTILSASLYLYVPIRLAAVPAYSEFEGAHDAKGVWAYVTAAKFQGHIARFNLQQAIRRLPQMAMMVKKQWLWPIFALVPLGLSQIRERSRPLGWFLGIALLCLFAFAFVYQIPDPEGFFMPIFLCLTMAVGAAFGIIADERRAIVNAAVVVLGGVLLWLGYPHLRHWASTSGQNTLEEMGGGPWILWDMDDLVTRVPAGSRIAVPCNHYGCVQILNYYRYADPATQERHLTWVRLPNMQVGYLDVQTAVKEVAWETALTAPTCSIRKVDADEWTTRGIPFETIERPGRTIREGPKDGVPIFCTTVSSPR